MKKKYVQKNNLQEFLFSGMSFLAFVFHMGTKNAKA